MCKIIYFFGGIINYIPLASYIRNTKLITMISNFNCDDNVHNVDLTMNESNRDSWNIKESRMKTIQNINNLDGYFIKKWIGKM